MITKHIIRIKALNVSDDECNYANLPRFNFKVKLPYGKSFTMKRRQFPLRLAYSMTMNGSQGQEFTRVLIDTTKPAFLHGHLYVALSRIRRVSNIAFYTLEENVHWGNVQLENAVYKEIWDCFK